MADTKLNIISTYKEVQKLNKLLDQFKQEVELIAEEHLENLVKVLKLCGKADIEEDGTINIVFPNWKTAHVTPDGWSPTYVNGLSVSGLDTANPYFYLMVKDSYGNKVDFREILPLEKLRIIEILLSFFE